MNGHSFLQIYLLRAPLRIQMAHALQRHYYVQGKGQSGNKDSATEADSLYTALVYFFEKFQKQVSKTVQVLFKF